MDVDLMFLQERCRKDPLSYKDDFISQKRHFDALLTSASLRPSEPSPRLTEVASFMGAVAHCYGKDGQSVSPAIASFLAESGPAMDPELRRALVRLLALLRARGSADPNVVIPLFFRLLTCNDKILRRMLHGHIVSDIKKIQASGHSSRRVLQSFLFAMVEDPSEILVKRSLHVLVDLFRKKIWNDSRSANMISKACFHPSVSVALIATKFLLDSESKDEDENDESDDETDVAVRKSHDGQKASDMWKTFNMTGRKTSKKRKRMEKVINRLTRTKTSTNSAVSNSNPDQACFEAMLLLNDPQDFAERLFSDVQGRRKKEPYETRLVFINLISRLVGTYQLILFNLYPFLQRYLQPAQPEVTKVLAYLTQACHEIVPSDVLHPILRGLADRFVSEKSSPPSVAAGINTIRAICSRVPLAILDEQNESKPEDEQESPLLEDLVQYKSDKDKGVAMAARSLIALYREVHPALLRKKERGRIAAVAVQTGTAVSAPAYGALKYATGVDGVELLRDEESDEDAESDDDVAENESGKEDEEDAGGEDDVSEQESGEHADEEANDEVEGNGDEAGKDESKRIDEMQILSNEDFAKIRARRAAAAVCDTTRTTNTGEAVDPDDLQGPIKRERKNLAERMESVLAGREGREKFGSRKGTNKGGGSSNSKKLKTKSNSMVIHKRRKRSKMGRREKQLSRRKKNDYK